MEYRNLFHFLSVCEQRSFTGAAKYCNISQQGLSNSIRQLENQLEAPLFLRNSSRIELTVFGRALYRAAKSYMDHHDQIVAEIRNLKIESASRVSLALPDGYADMFPEGFFRDFLLRHPAKSLDIMSFPPDYLQESATKRAIALGFCNSPVNTTFFEILHTWKHRLIIVAGERHPLANRSSIKLKELQGETLILLNNQRHPQPVLMDLCNRAGITRYAYLGVSDSRLYRELCSTNRFVSFWAGPVNVPGLIGIEVDELKDICTEANFIRNKNVWLGDAAAAFIAWTEERFP